MQQNADPFLSIDPEKLATFVQEYVRRESEPDAGTAAVIASQMREPRWLPHQLAEILLDNPAIQAAVKAVRATYKPRVAAEVSIDTISMDMETVFQDAMDARQFTAAIAAKKLQAEIKGMLSKTIDVNVRHSISTMSDAELESLARKKVIEGEFTDVSTLTALTASTTDE